MARPLEGAPPTASDLSVEWTSQGGTCTPSNLGRARFRFHLNRDVSSTGDDGFG
jgi:hypothetical protein